MRYFVALAIAGVLIIGLSVHANQTKRSLQQSMRQKFDEEKQSGQLPPDADFERDNVGMELPDYEKIHIGLVQLWINCRIILAPLLILFCLGIARLLDRRTPPPSATNSHAETEDSLR